MKKFTVLHSAAAALAYSNIDTDQIIPKQFLRSISRAGFGPFLFDEWRYLDRGELGMDCAARPQNPDFALNFPRYKNAKILLTRDNFGCGSSREHAVWALMDYGFRAVIAPSFGDIFYNNAVKNGLLPVVLSATQMDILFSDAAAQNPPLTVNLFSQTVVTARGQKFVFEIATSDKTNLLEGLDDIALTLKQSDNIRDYEKRRRRLEPWLFEDGAPCQ